MQALNELLAGVASGLSDAVRKPNVHNYTPNPGGQEAFHKSTATGRLLYGSNRSGKSVAGCVESVQHATGRHPYRRVPPPPVFGRIITVDFDYGCDQIIVPLLSQWLPPSELINGSWEDSYNRKTHLLTLANGSKIEIKAHGQDLLSFAGTPRHFLWVDEECPKAIFVESKARLIDYGGDYWITLTSVEGTHTWIYADLVEGDTSNVEVFAIKVADNAHVSAESVRVLGEDLDEEEKEIRIEGKFVPRGGLVFPFFDAKRHVIRKGLPPKGWTIYVSIDPGLNNPTAVLWHAVSPHGRVVTFYEHYKAGWTIKQHARKILEINEELANLWGLKEFRPQLYIVDPSASQRNDQTGHSRIVEYRRNGVPVAPGKKHKDNADIDRMNDYLRRDMWHITESCPNLIREIRKLPWKRYRSPKLADLSNLREEPLDKDNHTTDSSGYFFRFMPDLSPGRVQRAHSNDLLQVVSQTRTQPKNFPWQVDEALMAPRTSARSGELAWGEVP